MKIGILTLPLFDNYGGILQAVALYNFLHNQGHEVVLINKRPHLDNNIVKKTIKDVLLKIPFHDFKNIKTNKRKAETRDKLAEFHKSFIIQEIPNISKNLYTKKDLEDFSNHEKFDGIIVGSDQVWRKEYINDEYYKSYFLDFVNDKTKKIAYAASFGKDYWEGKNDLEDISKYLKDFNAISTREVSGISICKNSFSANNIKHVLDPTILIEREFYSSIISKYNVSNINKNGLLTYVLDEAKEKKEIIEFIQKNTSTEKINHLKGFKNKNTIYTIPQWIASFAHADIVVTDSFHGMLFSIIFEKNFFVIGNQQRGLDRFLSFLNIIKLQDRLVFNLEDLKNKKLNNIDYESVNSIIKENRKLSSNFLMDSLNGK